MLLFNSNSSTEAIELFQISIHLMLLFNASHIIERTLIRNFNTSNVTIQRDNVTKSSFCNSYFNTSNVTIQQSSNVTAEEKKFYFNTSNVTIQRDVSGQFMEQLLHFNTSNVTIQRQQPVAVANPSKFQYI